MLRVKYYKLRWIQISGGRIFEAAGRRMTSIMENRMIKKRAILCLSVILTVVLAAGVEMFWLSRQKTVKEYKESQVAFGNPLMGYARNAWYYKVSEDISLLYMDITWAELEPEEGVYDWEAIEKKNQLARWKSEGKHLVFLARKSIWTYRNGCTKKVEKPVNGMPEDMGKALLQIITIRRSFPVMSRQ